MTQEEKYGYMLYNTCFGGYGLSKAADEELKTRMTEEEHKAFESEYYGSIESRTHPKVIELYMEKGRKWMCDSYSSLNIFVYPLKYKKYIDIQEYDGKERCGIDFVKAYQDLIEDFLKRHDENPELSVADLKQEIAEFNKVRNEYNKYRSSYMKKLSSNTSDSD